MLCCVGLIGGMAVGQSLGGPWTYIAPVAGFGIGLVADMKFMKGMHGKKGGHGQTEQRNAENGGKEVTGTDSGAVRESKLTQSKAPHPLQQPGNG